MSLGGGGSDDGNCGNTNNDALHRAICGSVAACVTYVVAAGNSSADLSWLARRPAMSPPAAAASAKVASAQPMAGSVVSRPDWSAIHRGSVEAIEVPAIATRVAAATSLGTSPCRRTRQRQRELYTSHGQSHARLLLELQNGLAQIPSDEVVVPVDLSTVLETTYFFAALIAWAK